MRHRPQRWDPTSSHMRQFPSVSFWHTEHHLSELHFPPATASIQNQHCYFGEIVACHTQKERVFYLFFFLFVLLLFLLTLAAEWNFKGRLGHHSQWFFFPRCLALWETQKYGDKVKSQSLLLHSLFQILVWVIKLIHTAKPVRNGVLEQE